MHTFLATLLAALAVAGCSSSVAPDGSSDVAPTDATDILPTDGTDASDTADVAPEVSVECGYPPDVVVCAPGNACALCSAGPETWGICAPRCATDSDCHDPSLSHCVGSGCNGVHYCSSTTLGCSCGICAAETTLIATPQGERRITDIAVGDVVYGLRDAQLTTVRVVRVSRRAVFHHSVVRVTLQSGRVVQMSAGHPTLEGRDFGVLRAGDEIGGVRVDRAETVPYDGAFTYDLLTDGDDGAYVADGTLVGSTLAGP